MPRLVSHLTGDSFVVVVVVASEVTFIFFYYYVHKYFEDKQMHISKCTVIL